MDLPIQKLDSTFWLEKEKMIIILLKKINIYTHYNAQT